jgi:hypothetical protein
MFSLTQDNRCNVKRATMNGRIAALSLVFVFVLSGCAAPKIAGNEIGGAVPLAGITRQQAAEMARAHCAKYGRSARVLTVNNDGGAKAVFECI